MLEALEPRQLLSVSISTVSGNAEEQNQVAAQYAITRSGGSGTATVYYSVGYGTASPGDFDCATSSVVYLPGTSTVYLSVIPADDTDVEPTEDFTVSLTSCIGDALGDTQAGGSIADNDVNVTIEGDPVTVGFDKLFTIWTKDYYGNAVGDRHVTVTDHDADMIDPQVSAVTTGSGGSATIDIAGVDAETDGTEIVDAPISLCDDGGVAQHRTVPLGNPRLYSLDRNPITVIGGTVAWHCLILDAIGQGIKNTDANISLPNGDKATIASQDTKTSADGFFYAKFTGVALNSAAANALLNITINGAKVANTLGVLVEHAVVRLATASVTAGNPAGIIVTAKNSRNELVEGLQITLTGDTHFYFGTPNTSTKTTNSGDGEAYFLANASAGTSTLKYVVVGDSADNSDDNHDTWTLTIN